MTGSKKFSPVDTKVQSRVELDFWSEKIPIEPFYHWVPETRNLSRNQESAQIPGVCSIPMSPKDTKDQSRVELDFWSEKIPIVPFYHVWTRQSRLDAPVREREVEATETPVRPHQETSVDRVLGDCQGSLEQTDNSVMMSIESQGLRMSGIILKMIEIIIGMKL
jgi:hypothetical protein